MYIVAAGVWGSHGTEHCHQMRRRLSRQALSGTYIQSYIFPLCNHSVDAKLELEVLFPLKVFKLCQGLGLWDKNTKRCKYFYMNFKLEVSV